MFTNFYSPRPGLESFVQAICIVGHSFSPTDTWSPLYTYMPIHTRFLCFFLGDPIMVKKDAGKFKKRARAIIIGPQLTPVTLNMGKRQLNVVVVLRPCGLYRLTGIPMHEIVDRDFDAREVFGKEIEIVLDKLLNSIDNDRKNRIVQEYLLSKISKLKPIQTIDRIMHNLVRLKGNLAMDYLSSQACISIRQMQRHCAQRIGFSPKLFSKLVRFSAAYKYKEINLASTWTEIAFLHNYFDQMHLIKDFRQFTGVSPGGLNKTELSHSIRLSDFD